MKHNFTSRRRSRWIRQQVETTQVFSLAMTAVLLGSSVIYLLSNDTEACFLLASACVFQAAGSWITFGYPKSSWVRAAPHMAFLLAALMMAKLMGTSKGLSLSVFLMMSFPFLNHSLRETRSILTLLTINSAVLIAVSPLVPLFATSPPSVIAREYALLPPVLLGSAFILFSLARAATLRSKARSSSPVVAKVDPASFHPSLILQRIAIDPIDRLLHRVHQSTQRSLASYPMGPAHRALQDRLKATTELQTILCTTPMDEFSTPETFAVGEALEEVAMVLAPALHARRLHFSLDISNSGTVSITCSKLSFQALLIQLLAEPLNGRGDGEVSLHLGTTIDDQTVQLRLELLDNTTTTTVEHSQLQLTLESMRPWVQQLSGTLSRVQNTRSTSHTIIEFSAPLAQAETLPPLPLASAVVHISNPETSRVLATHLTNRGLYARVKGPDPTDPPELVITHAMHFSTHRDAARAFGVDPTQVLLVGTDEDNLPIDLPLPIQRTALWAATERSLQAPRANITEHGNPTRVLLIDDSPVERAVMKKLLHSLGFDTDVACDGAEAMNSFNPEIHHVVFTDLCMPRVNGLETALELRKRSPSAALTLVGVTSELELIDSQHPSGPFSALLPKPVRVQDVKRVLGHILKTQQTEAEAKRS